MLQVGKGSLLPAADSCPHISLEAYRFKGSIAEDIERADLVISHAGERHRSGCCRLAGRGASASSLQRRASSRLFIERRWARRRRGGGRKHEPWTCFQPYRCHGAAPQLHERKRAPAGVAGNGLVFLLRGRELPGDAGRREASAGGRQRHADGQPPAGAGPPAPRRLTLAVLHMPVCAPSPPPPPLARGSPPG